MEGKKCLYRYLWHMRIVEQCMEQVILQSGYFPLTKLQLGFPSRGVRTATVVRRTFVCRCCLLQMTPQYCSNPIQTEKTYFLKNYKYLFLFVFFLLLLYFIQKINKNLILFLVMNSLPPLSTLYFYVDATSQNEVGNTVFPVQLTSWTTIKSYTVFDLLKV